MNDRRACFALQVIKYCATAHNQVERNIIVIEIGSLYTFATECMRCIEYL